ncbi:hypothetical protein M1843_15965, partial [Isoptericola sp. 4D.3]|nr:hypothetical protein [Isoptericola sp. 4D.3]
GLDGRTWAAIQGLSGTSATQRAIAATGLDGRTWAAIQGLSGTSATQRAIAAGWGMNENVRTMTRRFYAGSAVSKSLSRYLEGIQGLGILNQPARIADFGKVLEKRRRQLLPSNLRGVDVTVEDLSRLANEGVTLWAVPRRQTAQQLIAAPNSGARREVLGRRGRAIIDDCQEVAAYAAGGPHAASARELEDAIAAERDGYLGPALSHIGGLLDSLMRDAIENKLRVRLVGHKSSNNQPVMDHFDELDLRKAMVFRPIWFAYRQMNTPDERALSTSFARHGVAHVVTGARVISFRNFVQAAMLAAALISFLSWWSEANW